MATQRYKTQTDLLLETLHSATRLDGYSGGKIFLY